MSNNPDKSEENLQELKSCFIITPIGDNGSETFLKASGLIDSVIKPVLDEFGFYALPAYDINAGGSINKQVIEHVVNDELVIANLTGFNANVMYELAIRHSFKKKVVIMAERGPKLPFDVSDQRTIFYSDTLHGVFNAKNSLRLAIKEVLESEVKSNPIIDAVHEAAIISNIKGENGDILKYIVEKLDRMEIAVSQKSNSRYANNENLIKSYMINQKDESERYKWGKQMIATMFSNGNSIKEIFNAMREADYSESFIKRELDKILLYPNSDKRNNPDN